MKRIKLKVIKKIQGLPFRDVVRDDNDLPELEIRKDKEGNPIMQVPRNERGEAIPGAIPEPVYVPVTKDLGIDALPTLLKSLYLRIPQDKLTRQDTIFGVKLFNNIEASPKGYLELDEDVHDWVKKKLQDEGIGLKIFGVDLGIIEQAVDDIEKKVEPKAKEGVAND